MDLRKFNKKKTIELYRDLGYDVRDISPCCVATVFNGCCCACGKPIPMPFYFVTTKHIDDGFLTAREKFLREKLPVGSDFIAYVP